MRLPQPPPKRGRIEIVPMIDAIFFLLVYFMFSSLSMVKMNGLGVALPQAAGTAAQTGANQAQAIPGGDTPKLWVSISDEGLIRVDNTPMNPNNIGAMVRAKLAGKKNAVVIVQPAGEGKMQTLVAVMDILNETTLANGTRPRVLIATEAVDTPSTARP